MAGDIFYKIPTDMIFDKPKDRCAFLNGIWIFDDTILNWVNHSCDPNTYTKTNNGIRQVIAMRDIKEGEEITYDYSMNGDNDGTFECRCGSAKCRKIYQGDFFKLPKELQIYYLPYLDDWFKRKYKDKISALQSDGPLR